jgi:Ala-tRNA(Pro) deacylase
MILSREKVLLMLDRSNFEYRLYEHPPIFTVEDAEQHCSHVPGVHVKNLFLRNKKKTAYWLATIKEDKRVDLLALGSMLNEGRLSFVNPNDLVAMLGVQPGSVTPLAIINDHAKRVKLIFDNDLSSEKYISIHPLENTATISVKLCDLLRFIESNIQGEIKFMEIPTS